MLKLIHGNRLDTLAERMLATWPEALLEDLRPRSIVVPSAGIARWLKYAIADRHRICCNIEFPYPAQFIWRTFAKVLPKIPETSPFDSATMTWRLFGLFGTLPTDETLKPLLAYLAATDERGRMELARRIAGLFDQYLVLRPDWLKAWRQRRLLGLANDATENWQAHLWRELLSGMASGVEQHPKEAVFAALERLRANGADLGQLLPRRLDVFAVPLLAPLYYEVFLRLSRLTEVHLYVLNPCREYWADIVSERDLARIALDDRRAAEFREVGHPLLASLGRQRRDNLALLAALSSEDASEEEDAFEPPIDNTLLHRLQRSILELQDLVGDDGAHAGDASLAHDRSIQIHACHSLTRQLEVLHDQLLALFEAHDDLRPADVVVMTPDLDTAAPVIDAVFGSAPAQRFISYTVSGRKRPDATPLLHAFATLLTLPDSRFDTAAVLDLLQAPPIARRFGLTETDLRQIRDWLREAGVRWGLDASHRVDHGLPAEPRHTWADGIARLLLGYALPGQGEQTFAGLLPCDDIEGNLAQVLGQLMRALSELRETAAFLCVRHNMSAWQRILHRMIKTFFAPDEAEQIEMKRLQQAIASLAEQAANAAVDAAIGIGVVADAIAAQLVAGAPGAVPSGAVTFCGIEALRGIPHRVICLIGLDDGAFPRNAAPLEFDLMVGRPRLGDRARRDDDRGSFLDALLAASDVFYLSYSGRSVQDNALLPPSMVIGELLDYVGLYRHGGREAAARQLITEHPLQPFSRRYFDGGELFSYASEYVAAARIEVDPLAEKSNSRALFDAPLPVPGEEWRRIELDRLTRFFNHPVKFLLRERLRIDLTAAEEELAVAEPFVLERQSGWQLRDRLLALAGQGLADEHILRIAGAGAELPHAFVGSAVLAREHGSMRRFFAVLERIRPTAALDPMPFEFTAAGVTVIGVFDRLSGDGQFGFRPGARSVFDLLSAWLHHLALNHLKPAGAALTTRWLNSDKLLELTPVADASAHLDNLLALYWRGLQAPLLFLPRSALARFEHSERAALNKWSSDWGAAENSDPWYRLLFGETRNKLPDGFEEVAESILCPLWSHLTQKEIATLMPMPASDWAVAI